MFSTKKETKICRFYSNGNCNKGDDCRYSHDGQVQVPVEVKRETKTYCWFCQIGKCDGRNKHYIHTQLTAEELAKMPIVFSHELARKRNSRKWTSVETYKMMLQNTKTSVRFTINENGIGMIRLMVPVKFTDGLQVLTPSLEYTVKYFTGTMKLVFCKNCLGCKSSPCPAEKMFASANQSFKLCLKGMLCEFIVTLCDDGTYSIHSDPAIRDMTMMVKANANENFAQEYAANGEASATSGRDEGKTPVAFKGIDLTVPNAMNGQVGDVDQTGLPNEDVQIHI